MVSVIKKSTALLLIGVYSLTLTLVGFTGLASAAAPPTVAITSPTASSNVGTSFAVNGTATANKSITVKVNGVTVGSTTSDGAGNWSVNVTGQTAGSKTITATATGDILAYLPDIGSTNLGVVNVTQGSFSTVAGTFGAQDASPLNNGKVFTLDTQIFGTSNQVSVFDGTPLTHTVDTPQNDPFSSALSESAHKLYVTDPNDNQVAVIDTNTDVVLTTIPVGTSPQGIVISPDGTKVYVANGSGSSVSVIDTSTDTVTQTPSVCASSFNLTISPDGTMLYVLCQGTGIEKFDTATFTSHGTAAIPASLLSLAITPDGSKIYANGFGSLGIAMVNTADMSVNIGYGSTSATSLQIIGNKLYLEDLGTNEFQIYDTATDTQVGTGISTIGLSTPVNISTHFMIQQTSTASVSVTVVSAPAATLASTGQNENLYTLISIVTIGLGLSIIYRLKQKA